MMAEPRTTHNPMPPTETPTSVGVLCCVGWFAVCAASLAYLIYWIVMRAT